MTTIATLYGEAPLSPKSALRCVLPLPAGHSYNTSIPDQSPFSIKVGEAASEVALDTSCVPIAWRPDGTVSKVLLTAIATDEEAAAASRIITDDASTDGAFLTGTDPTVLAAALAGFDITVKGPDGDYSACIKADMFGAQVNKTTATVPFTVQLIGGEGTLLDHLGYLKGFITIYSKIGVIDLDFIWVSSEISYPRNAAFFSKIEMSVPDTFQVKSKIVGSYWGEGPEADGVTKIDLISQALSTPGSTAPYHTIFPLEAKTFRLSVFKEEEADTLPDWADDWVTNNGWLFTSSATAYADDPDGYHDANPATPVSVSGVSMPDLDAAVVADVETEMDGFLSTFAAGGNTEWFGDDSSTSFAGFKNRVGGAYGGQTGGTGIVFFGYRNYAVAGHRQAPKFFYNLISGLVDRQYNYMNFGLEPIDVRVWQEANPDTKLEFSIVQGPSLFDKDAPGGRVVCLMFGTSDETGWRMKDEEDTMTNSNSLLITGLPPHDWDVKKSFGNIDHQHYPRFLAPQVTAAEYMWHPFERLLLVYAASAIMLDSPSPLYLFNNGGPGRGGNIGRAHGWGMWTVASCYHFLPPSARTSGTFGYTIYAYASEYEKVLRSMQMANGGIIAWDSKSNKEGAAAYFDLLGPALAEHLEAQGVVPLGGGEWDDFDKNSKANVNWMKSILPAQFVLQKEKEVGVCYVAQPYQECILHSGMWMLTVCVGVNLLLEFFRSFACVTNVYRRPTVGAPWYLVGVYPSDKPAQVSMTPTQVENLYFSGGDYSVYYVDGEGTGKEVGEWNYRHSLSIVAAFLESNPYLIALVKGICDVLGRFPDDDLEDMTNAEGLLAVEQRQSWT